MRRLARFLTHALLTIALAAPLTAGAQDARPFSAGQLDQMLAPIALFPDALLAQVLMAATYPSDVAEAVTWAKAHQNVNGDDAVKAVQDKPWDPSVQSLVAFPQVLAMMGEKPQWVQDVGDAFLGDANAVMDSVQRLRSKAQQAGNLKSNEQITVASEPAPPPAQPAAAGAPPPVTQIITIQPANPQVVFVPVYNPVVFGPWWWPMYPPIFIPPPPGWGFATGVITAGIAWGVGIGVRNALWGGVNWGRGDVNINVNNFNNINVNNRINTNNNNVNWRHDSNNRRGVPYRDARTREQQARPLPGRDDRQDYRGRDSRPPDRGRDAQRAQAEQALAGRVGAQNMDRGALANVDRSTLQDRGGGPAGGTRDRPAGGRGEPDRAQDRSARAGNADNAFRGAGNGAQTRQQIDRGAASRETMNARPQPAMQRPQQAPQRPERPQQAAQRPDRPQQGAQRPERPQQAAPRPERPQAREGGGARPAPQRSGGGGGGRPGGDGGRR